MNDDLTTALSTVLKKMQIVWAAVFIGVITLLLMTVVIYTAGLIDHIPVIEPTKIDNVALVIILVCVISIFYIKQTVINAPKLLSKAKESKTPLQETLAQLADNQNEQMQLFLKSIQILNKYMLIVWLVADIVVLTAVVSFILAPVLNKLLMYSLVGLFSLLINFPTFGSYKKVHRYMYE